MLCAAREPWLVNIGRCSRADKSTAATAANKSAKSDPPKEQMRIDLAIILLYVCIHIYPPTMSIRMHVTLHVDKAWLLHTYQFYTTV